MTFAPHFPDGYYDKNGEWQRTKFCFVSCGAACTCGPPGGQYYSATHDARQGADRGSIGGLAGSGRAIGVEASDGVCMPVEGADTSPKGT